MIATTFWAGQVQVQAKAETCSIDPRPSGGLVRLIFLPSSTCTVRDPQTEDYLRGSVIRGDC